jgi:DNA-binding transcriptional ArsR family regulator
MNRELYDHRARIIKAVAHPSRLAMLDALAGGERCVCELQEIVGSEMSTVSKHLALMKAAGIVTDRKAGLQVFYRLQTPCLLGFLKCVDGVIRSNARTQQRLAAAAR